MPAGDQERPSKSYIKYLSLGVGVIGGLVGIAVDLYADQARFVVEEAWARFAIRWLIILVVVVGSCYLTWRLSDRLWVARIGRQSIVAKSLEIHTEDFEEDLPKDQAVIGRSLRYLERQSNSRNIIVFLHGLGLDANDFRRFMRSSDIHAVAITLFGFNADDAQNNRYRPIGLSLHAELVTGAIRNIQRQNPGKELILVGFSLGADLIFKLAEIWHDRPERSPSFGAALLLDPNVNHSTMNISSAISKMDTVEPLTELKRLVGQTSSLVEFQNICEYLHKITYKNLDSVRRFAGDFTAYWNADDSTDLFLDRVVILNSLASRVRVIFSFHYEQHFNGLVAAARAKGVSRNVFEATSLDHFELIGEELLARELDQLGVPQRRGKK